MKDHFKILYRVIHRLADLVGILLVLVAIWFASR
jgi:hypothetical protein